MQTPPLFTQKHYEHMIEALRERLAPPCCVDLLCEIFAADNAKFKPALFRDSVNRE